MSRISIVGYTQDDCCQHCGRKLKHVVKLSDGRMVGATCFDKKLTKPRQHLGKQYRVGANHIVDLAKIAQYWTPEKQMRMGYVPAAFDFETSE